MTTHKPKVLYVLKYYYNLRIKVSILFMEIYSVEYEKLGKKTNENFKALKK